MNITQRKMAGCLKRSKGERKRQTKNFKVTNNRKTERLDKKEGNGMKDNERKKLKK